MKLGGRQPSIILVAYTCVHNGADIVEGVNQMFPGVPMAGCVIKITEGVVGTHALPHTHRRISPNGPLPHPPTHPPPRCPPT